LISKTITESLFHHKQSSDPLKTRGAVSCKYAEFMRQNKVVNCTAQMPGQIPFNKIKPGRKLNERIYAIVGWGCVEWIHLAQHRDRWWAVVNAVMNLRVLAPQR
jgi:hypothetical protein